MVSFLNALRASFTMDPREARAFVTGASDVDQSLTTFGVGGEAWQPGKYVDYIATSNGVYACINARTKNLSSLPLMIFNRRKSTDGRRKEVTSGPARELLDRVNPYWTFQRWLDMTEQSLCVWGESFSFYEKRGNKPVEIWWARADRVTVHPHPTEYISHFTYDAGNGNHIRFERDETLWIRYPNIANQWEGLSPLGAARLAADTSSAAMKNNYNIFQNGLSGAGLVYPAQGQNLTEDQAKEVADGLNRRLQGVKNAHKISVLRFGVDIKQLSLTPKDAEFLGMMNLSLEDIARAYAVPIDKIGGKRTYQNVDESEKVFWNDCIIPEARMIAAEITEQLLPLFGGDMVAEFDDSGVAVLHEAETARWERWQGQITTGARLINEYRAEEGLEPVPWGDVWWGQSTVTPISSDEKPVAPVPPALAANAGIDDSEKSEEPETEDDSERSRRTRTIEYGGADHVARMQRADELSAPWEQQIAAQCTRMMLDQKQSILAQLRQRGYQRSDQLALNPFDESRWIKAFRVGMRPLIRHVVSEAAGYAIDELPVAFGFKVNDPRVIRAIENQAQAFAIEVNDTTWNQLRDSLTEGVANGESIDDLAARVENVMGDRIRSSGEVIARTETTRASTTGTIEAWEQSGVVVGKEWVAALDKRTRKTHTEAHGQIVGLHEPFHVGAAFGDGPGNMNSASESVNCRCTVVAVLDV